jgi:hypothetical protein
VPINEISRKKKNRERERLHHLTSENYYCREKGTEIDFYQL